MPDRRYTEDEARRIFARVAERQHASATDPGGLSLGELRRAAEAAGLDPALVAAAAAELDTPGDVERHAGLPVEARRARVLPGRVSDEAWERMVATLRREFREPGVPTDIGRLREWTSSGRRDAMPPVRVTLEPTPDGTRLTVEQSMRENVPALWVLPGVFGGMGVLFPLLAALNLGDPKPGVGYVGLVFLVLGLVAGLVGYGWLRGWAPKQERRFDALLDRLELDARTAAPPAVPDAHAPAAEPRLDAGLLDAPPDAGEARAHGRTRTR